jgi:hypothetical protein
MKLLDLPKMQDWPTFAAHLKKSDIGYFTPLVRKKIHNGIHGSAFVNYIEFYLEEIIASRISFLPGHEMDSHTLEQVRQVIWCDPTILSFLKKHYRNDPIPASAMVDSAANAFHETCGAQL